jgi:hypothetical protein
MSYKNHTLSPIKPHSINLVKEFNNQNDTLGKEIARFINHRRPDQSFRSLCKLTGALIFNQYQDLVALEPDTPMPTIRSEIISGGLAGTLHITHKDIVVLLHFKPPGLDLTAPRPTQVKFEVKDGKKSPCRTVGIYDLDQGDARRLLVANLMGMIARKLLPITAPPPGLVASNPTDGLSDASPAP